MTTSSRIHTPFWNWSKDELALFGAYIQGLESSLPNDTETLVTLRGLRSVEYFVIQNMRRATEPVNAPHAVSPAEYPLTACLEAVRSEVLAAQAKHPAWPSDPLHALAILREEFGELTKAMLQLAYQPEKSSKAHVAEEALQTAAMAVRLLIHLSDFVYLPAFSGRKPDRTDQPVGDREP
jgi:hypothetical protein